MTRMKANHRLPTHEQQQLCQAYLVARNAACLLADFLTKSRKISYPGDPRSWHDARRVLACCWHTCSRIAIQFTQKNKIDSLVAQHCLRVQLIPMIFATILDTSGLKQPEWGIKARPKAAWHAGVKLQKLRWGPRLPHVYFWRILARPSTIWW